MTFTPKLTGAPEKRIAWSNIGQSDPNSDWLAILNGLGGQGWELVTLAPGSSRLGDHHGWTSVSLPISVTATFKRPRELDEASVTGI